MIKKILLLSGLMAFTGVFAQKTHTVGKGDNPYNIAKKYGMTMEELLRMNPKAKDGKLQIGDVLVINNKSKVAPKTEKPKTNVVEKPKNTVVEKPSTAELGKITLQPKQTIYGLTKQYHISEAELRRLNPALDSGMKIGDQIVLPMSNIKKYADNQAFSVTVPAKVTVPDQSQPKSNTPPPARNVSMQTSVQDDYITYTVQDGDTVFAIVNRFGITMDQLISLNPSLAGGLKPGMVLKIKKIDAEYIKKDNNALNVVLMLPFGFDSNDSKYRTMSMDFLAGARLAAERNAKAGQQLDIKVVDAGNEVSFRNSLTQINTDNTDLIIGPFFKTNVLEVLQYVGAKKIPVVAPFANSSDLYDYSNLIIVETSDQVYADRIVKEVKDAYSDQKIYIVADASKQNANYIKTQLEQTLKSPNISIISSPLDIQADKNMMTGQSAPVIAVLASDDNAIGEGFANRIIALAREVQGMKTFSMYYVPLFDKKVDELGEANLLYLADRKVNTEGDFEKEVLADYKRKYCKAPTKYAAVGFDVMNDMLTRENRKGEIFRQMGKTQTQLASKFEFVRVKGTGAYVNNGYRVVRFGPQ